MKIYIVERNNPVEWEEPQIYLEGKKAVEDVKNEYNAQMEELGTTQEKADKGFGSCGCYYMVDEDRYYGSCLIDRDIDGDRWEWRITEHEIY